MTIAGGLLTCIVVAKVSSLESVVVVVVEEFLLSVWKFLVGCLVSHVSKSHSVRGPVT